VSIVYMLIPLGLVLVGVGLWAFFWAVGSGQFDDLDSPGWSVLSDEEGAKVDGTPQSPDPGARDPETEGRK
jgi:cbb3-type cytochrome oxidase maturation protein